MRGESDKRDKGSTGREIKIFKNEAGQRKDEFAERCVCVCAFVYVYVLQHLK